MRTYGAAAGSRVDSASHVSSSQAGLASIRAGIPYSVLARRVYAIRHTFPDGGILGDGFIHSGDTYPQPIAPFFSPGEATDMAARMLAHNPTHTFKVVAHPDYA